MMSSLFNQSSRRKLTWSVTDGRARYSVRAGDHAGTAPIRLVFGFHGAHGVTRPTIASIPRLLPAICLVLAAGLVLAGCGRKESKTTARTPEGATAAQAAAAPAANPVDPAAPLDLQAKMRLQQAVAMRDGKAPAAPTMTLRGGEPATTEVLAAYNQQLTQLIFRQRDAPETLDELVRKWPMPRLPTPPAGKRIVYDARNRIIVLYPP